MLTMYSALAQEESRQQSVRVSSGIHERMESGNIVKCKPDTAKEEFRKQIKTIAASIDESQYLDSIAVRHNGEMIKYKYCFYKCL